MVSDSRSWDLEIERMTKRIGWSLPREVPFWDHPENLRLHVWVRRVDIIDLRSVPESLSDLSFYMCILQRKQSLRRPLVVPLPLLLPSLVWVYPTRWRW